MARALDEEEFFVLIMVERWERARRERRVRRREKCAQRTRLAPETHDCVRVRLVCSEEGPAYKFAIKAAAARVRWCDKWLALFGEAVAG